jgi:hypothetical protein
MVIKILDDKSIWDNFIDDSYNGLIFHKWDFLKIVEKYSNYECLFYGVYNNDSLNCVFPIFLKKMYNFKIITSPPPKSAIPYLGFVLPKNYVYLKQKKKEQFLELIINDFLTILKEIKPNYIRITLTPKLVDVRLFKWSDFLIDINYTYKLDLTQEYDFLVQQSDRNTRRNNLDNIKISNFLIKKGADDLQYFYDRLSKRYQEQQLNLPIYSYQYLRDIIEIYKNNIELINLYENSKIVASAVVCKYLNQCYYWLSSVEHVKGGLSYNTILTWELLKNAKLEGNEIFDFCGANNKNISAWKSHFNPYLDINYSIYKKDIIGSAAESVYLNIVKKNI